MCRHVCLSICTGKHDVHMPVNAQVGWRSCAYAWVGPAHVLTVLCVHVCVCRWELCVCMCWDMCVTNVYSVIMFLYTHTEHMHIIPLWNLSNSRYTPQLYFTTPYVAPLLHWHPLPLSCCSPFQLPAIIFPPSFDHLLSAQPLSRSLFSSIVPSPSICLPRHLWPPFLIWSPIIPSLPLSSPHLILPDQPSAFPSWGLDDGEGWREKTKWEVTEEGAVGMGENH